MFVVMLQRKTDGNISFHIFDEKQDGIVFINNVDTILYNVENTFTSNVIFS